MYADQQIHAHELCDKVPVLMMNRIKYETYRTATSPFARPFVWPSDNHNLNNAAEMMIVYTFLCFIFDLIKH